MTGKIIVRVLTTVFIVAIAGFFSTQWIGYAVLGLILGLAVGVVIRQLRRSTRFRWIFAFLILVGAMAFGLSFPFTSLEVAQRPPPIEFKYTEVNYTATISASPGISQWQIREQFLIPDSQSLTKWLDRYSILNEALDSDVSDTLSEEIKQQLQRDEWTSAGFVGASEQFRRDRNIEGKPDWIRATTIIEIPVRIGYVRLYRREIRFVPDSTSEITITTPKYVVSSTFPAYTSRQDMLRGGQERLKIPLEFTRLDEPQCSIAVLNPLLRWPLGPSLGAFSLWSGVQWILLAMCAVFSDQLKEKILKPIVAPLFPPKSETHKNEARLETPESGERRHR